MAVRRGHKAQDGLKEREEVYVIKSIYYADGRPYCINTSILPKELFPKLELFDFNRNSLYEVLKSFYQLSFTKARQVLNATVGSSEILRISGDGGETSLCSQNQRPPSVCIMILRWYRDIWSLIY
ncbi:MAG: UTRA domain-containing protein [Enterocloster clostridioformis]